MQERVAAVLHGCPDNQKDTLRKSHKIRPSMKRKIIQRRHWSCKIRHNQNRLLGELSYQESQNTDVISRLMPVQWIESQTGKERLLNCGLTLNPGLNPVLWVTAAIVDRAIGNYRNSLIFCNIFSSVFNSINLCSKRPFPPSMVGFSVITTFLLLSTWDFF